MTVTILDVDRNISTLRLNSQSFSEVSNKVLYEMFEESIQNIKNVAYFWATISADNKGVAGTVAEGEEWLGGPFASTIALQYYIDFLKNNNTELIFTNNNLIKNKNYLIKILKNYYFLLLKLIFISLKICQNLISSIQEDLVTD